MAALVIGLLPTAAMADQQQLPTGASSDSTPGTPKSDHEIIVTGTRITATGFKAPTPRICGPFFCATRCSTTVRRGGAPASSGSHLSGTATGIPSSTPITRST
ncbi:hypothetical protein KXW36_001240, partial [Aspergillus fumigatus]